MLSDSGVRDLGPTTWADLGCGSGTFTLALAELLAAGSTIYAIDRDASALREIPAAYKHIQIITHRADFSQHEWPFDTVDGILMANALHYIEDQPAFIRRCERAMKGTRRFLIVEYDLEEPNPWVPHPVSRARLAALFPGSDYSIAPLGSRPSVYRRAPLYAALINGR